MAAAKLVSLLLLFVFTTGIFSDAGEEPTSASEIQLDQLNAKIRALESQIDEKSREVKGREELVAVKDNLLHERQDKLSSLETQLSSLRKKGSSDSVEVLEKAKARATELEKQVEVLRNFLEQKNKEKESTEARRSEAEKKLNELNSRLEKIYIHICVLFYANINKKVLQLHKTKEEQKGKIRKLERALKISEEEMLRMRHEAATKARELQEKYIPAIKETVKTHVEPHVQTLSTKAKEAYHASKSAVTPHIVKFQEHVDPYYQEAKKFSKPYVDQVATSTKPHVDKVRATMKPYTKKAVHYYKEFLKSATTYHHQVQANIERKLKSHELAAPFATKEFIWFTASALFALPIFIVYKFLCSLFWQVFYN
ncbi:hypothetical protein F2Q70_00027821 [Brassica cretica]|uniref:Uncharacterized protein n=1 Tax=Brassica cretica TaxID=69181 RepID=A0A8S9L8Y2_BRACR|nr:hypothetical protein F2Q70_00027821 [Brassica cretica]